MPSTAVDALFSSFQSALAGRYSLERELGRGGMGVVYLAREVRLDRPVAIKLLPPEPRPRSGCASGSCARRAPRRGCRTRTSSQSMPSMKPASSSST